MRMLFIFILSFIPNIIIAQIGTIPFSIGDFEVDILQYSHMILVENPVSYHLDTHYTFTNNEANYQVRYTLFRQTNKDDPNIKIPFTIMITPIIWNIAGRQVANIRNFDDIEVQLAFNGTFGSTILIDNPTSDFGAGYNYILLNFFYKNNQGFIVQSILSNDRNFFTFQNSIFSDIFHSFRFRN